MSTFKPCVRKKKKSCDLSVCVGGCAPVLSSNREEKRREVEEGGMKVTDDVIFLFIMDS